MHLKSYKQYIRCAYSSCLYVLQYRTINVQYIFINLRSLLLYDGVNYGTRFHRDRYTSVSTASYATVHLLVYNYVAYVEDTACCMANRDSPSSTFIPPYALQRHSALYITKVLLRISKSFPLDHNTLSIRLQSPLPPLPTVPL